MGGSHSDEDGPSSSSEGGPRACVSTAASSEVTPCFPLSAWQIAGKSVALSEQCEEFSCKLAVEQSKSLRLEAANRAAHASIVELEIALRESSDRLEYATGLHEDAVQRCRVVSVPPVRRYNN